MSTTTEGATVPKPPLRPAAVLLAIALFAAAFALAGAAKPISVAFVVIGLMLVILTRNPD